MYLKEIEIIGFKSFADKVTLSLDNDITCIVGPNGSGKSNIVDAIKFVLGEQSIKNLRADNLMSDVIFSGSKNRAGMHSASVTLTFDNSSKYLNIPYNNVSVKRRLYKTGDNEYFLNNEKCRLKDIIDLFLDSNIGKNSFNIIGQGEIAKILSSSPLERRFIIEEAAGILKYKKRREEAFKKLDKTKLNLDRLNDIIKEVEKQRNPLKEQSEKALKYLDTKNELKRIEVALLQTEITNYNDLLTSDKNKLKILEDNLIEINKILTNPELDTLKIKEIELSKSIFSLNQELITKNNEKEALNSQRIIKKEQEKYNSSDLKIYNNIEYLKETNLKIEQDIKLLELDENKLKENKIKLESNLNNLIDELNNNKEKYYNLDLEYNNLKRNNLEFINKQDILINNLNDNSYLNINVKHILNNKNLTGIIDCLINIIEIDNIYRQAFDVVSVSNKNFVIASTMESIKEAINYLKENNLGRITFLPLNIIKAKNIDNDTLNILNNCDGYLGVLSDFIKYDSIYKNIILNQFGNIIVASDIDKASNIAKLINHKYRIVSLKGDVFHVGGSVTGGNIESKNNLTIKNDIQSLQNKIAKNKEKINNIFNQMNELSNKINDFDKQIYEKRSALIEIIDELNQNHKKMDNLKKEYLDKTNELNNLTNNNNIEEIDKKYYDKSLECQIINQKLNDLYKEKEELDNRIIELDGMTRESRNDYTTIQKEINRISIEISQLDNKIDDNLNILSSEYNMTYERARDEFALSLELDEAKKVVNEYKIDLKNIGMVNLDSIKEFESVNERYLYLKGELEDLLNASDTLHAIINDMDEVMKDNFIDTFDKLKIEFKNVFQSMFKGGDACLKLVDPSNILESGIEIIASPPGKKLKTISLLSGGEKTLTAISLLFAILNIRKVPFCIFDEIEAALDEANVDNFGNYLNHYKDKTQFLLITHKKRTMEYAKTLYGITMQEYGVSKLVSVKLEGTE